MAKNLGCHHEYDEDILSVREVLGNLSIFQTQDMYRGPRRSRKSFPLLYFKRESCPSLHWVVGRLQVMMMSWAGANVRFPVAGPCVILLLDAALHCVVLLWSRWAEQSSCWMLALPQPLPRSQPVHCSTDTGNKTFLRFRKSCVAFANCILALDHGKLLLPVILVHICLDTWWSPVQYWPRMRHQQNRGVTLGDWLVPALTGRMAAKSLWRKRRLVAKWQKFTGL